MRQIYKDKECFSESFLGCDAYYHSHYQCAGVKLCQYAAPRLREFQHTRVDEDIIAQINEIRQDIGWLENSLVKRGTYT
jgi:hypothetical protein